MAVVAVGGDGGLWEWWVIVVCGSVGGRVAVAGVAAERSGRRQAERYVSQDKTPTSEYHVSFILLRNRTWCARAHSRG